jgi:hypothetical protein
MAFKISRDEVDFGGWIVRRLALFLLRALPKAPPITTAILRINLFKPPAPAGLASAVAARYLSIQSCSLLSIGVGMVWGDLTTPLVL